MSSLRTIALLLLTLVLVPTAAFVAYELSALDENEQLMADIYDQQLETLLFSINQHAWDVAEAWADKLDRVHADNRGDAAAMEAGARVLLDAFPTVQSVFMADSLVRDVISVTRSGAQSPEPVLEAVEIGQLLQQRRAGYRRLVATSLPGEDGSPSALSLAFIPAAYADGSVHVIGLILNAQPFVQDVLVPKLTEVARSSYSVGLFREGADLALFVTGSPENAPLRLSEVDRVRSLWVLPDYRVGIRPAGASVSELVHARFRRNMVLVVVLALALLVAAWFVFRSVRRQVQFARLKSDFVSNVSHELRTPLALIRMYAETLEMGRVRSEERRLEYYRIISQETDRLTHLVNNILNFSRMEAGRKKYAFAPVDLNEVVRDVHRLYSPPLERDGFDVELRLAPGLPPIRADRDAVTEALINLVDNAAKYSGDARRIEIETGTAGGGVFAAVRDHGIGIAPEDRKRIFEKFYRVSTGLVHTTKGTGLGLTLVHHIAADHGGRVDVESRLGEGSRFVLRFPALREAEAPDPSPAVAPAS